MAQPRETAREQRVAGATVEGGMPRVFPEDRIPLPPPDAKVYTTACDYCIVGCGYKAYVWPVGREGGPQAHENALQAEFPTGIMSGQWISPAQSNVVLVNGQPHHVIVKPDGAATVVNRGGNHSIRGGNIAQKCYNPQKPTADRLQTPLLRVGHALQPVSWEYALTIMAEVSRHVLDRYGELAWGMKMYSYQYFENTYALTKLAFQSIETPCWAPHDKPAEGNDTAGIDDAGIITFSAAYEDYALADVIFISGTDPYETKTVIFTEWMMKGPAKLIMVLPRKTMGAAYAEKNGGLFLQITPGTDTILHLALARLILENGWEDTEFIQHWVATRWEIDAGFGRGTRNTPSEWRTTWGTLGTDFAGYKSWLLNYQYATLDVAERLTGIPAEHIRRAAELLAKPTNGVRPKTSFALEKGNYWSNNYLNTASFASLALLCGAGNRPGRMISRLGGHQRGMIAAGPYPIAKSPEKYPGRRRKELDLDRWAMAGNLRWMWIIGTTWLSSMAASQELADSVYRQTRGHSHQVMSFDPHQVVQTLKARVDAGGMVLVVQDIYLQPIADFADLVLPAATWGEEDFTRCNGERRLRLYAQFYDPPGDAKPDWWIAAQFAKHMGFDGYAWRDSNDVFEEAAKFSRGGVLDYAALVEKARMEGKRGHDLLREYGTEGIQTPIRLENGTLVGTKRLHDPTLQLPTPQGITQHPKWLTTFNTHSGKAILHKSPWELFQDFYARITPKGDELWITNGRINEIWQSGFDDKRKTYIMQRWPGNFLELHPEDAKARDIESGDLVVAESHDILVQTSGFYGVEDDDLSFAKLMHNGHIKVGRGACTAIAVVTDALKPGVAWMYFLWPGSSANSLVHAVPDPITNRARFKLGKGRVRKIGESPYKRSFSTMSFAPRHII